MPENHPAVQQLLAARGGHQSLEVLDQPPESDAEAYAVQQQVIEASGRTVAGWKIGATSEFARQVLGCDEPFSGPIFADQVHDSGVVIPAGTMLNPMIEPEIAVVLGTDLPGGDVTPAAAGEAVADVRAAIELAGGCFHNIGACGYRALIADCGANQGIVLGAPVRGWRDIDLGTVPVELQHNGEVKGSGVGADAMGGPMHALAWLANHLSARGVTLRKGDIVTTGTIGGMAVVAPGDTGSGSHGPLGGVEFTYAGS